MQEYRGIKFHTLTAALLTPFYPGGKVNIDPFFELFSYVRESGIKSYVILGTTGEALCADFRNRRDLYDQIPNLGLKDDETAIVGTGGKTVEETNANSALAMDNGATALLVVTPDFWPDNNPDYDAFFHGVLQTGYPTIVYNKPGAKILTAEWIEKMAERHKNLVGVKSGDVDMLIEASRKLGDEFYLSCGNDMYIWHAAASGLSATSGWASCFPDEIRYIAENCRTEHVKTGAVQTALTNFIKYTQDPVNFGGKAPHHVAVQKAALRYIQENIPEEQRIQIGNPKCYDPVPDEFMPFLYEKILEFRAATGEIMSDAAKSSLST